MPWDNDGLTAEVNAYIDNHIWFHEDVIASIREPCLTIVRPYIFLHANFQVYKI